MSEYIVNLNNGKTDEKGQFRLLGKLLTSSGVMESAALTVAAQASPDMTVKVSGSAASDNIVFITSSGDTYHGWNTASYNVTIAANASGVSKTDAVIAYADTAAGSSTANNPAGLKFTSVRGASGAPSDGEINTAISSKPFLRLATVVVANGAASINSGNITDVRVQALIASSIVSTASIQANAVTANSTVQTFTDSASDDGATMTAISSDGWKDVTNLSRTITTTGGDVAIGFTIPMDNTSTAGTTLIRILDGSTAKHKLSVAPGSVGPRHVVSCSVILSSISAASHTFKVQCQMLAGGGATARFFTGQSTMFVEEHKR